MNRRVRWGILSTARVATNRIIPGMRDCAVSEVAAIASRDESKARAAAEKFGIAKAYGSYEALLADPDIDAIYNPLPNHLHVPWSILATRAGKHVLCEKPLGVSAAEIEDLIRARDESGVKVGEAFMVRTHPRWIRARELVREGRLGKLRAISGYFTFPLSALSNIRYSVDAGGGALMDIGCYQIHLSRMLFGEEPRRVMAMMDRHPEDGVDLLTSMLLEFSTGQASFTCAFDAVWSQRMTLMGSTARMEIDTPTAAPDSRPTRLWIDDGSDWFGGSAQVEEFAACNQYGVHMDAFARAILDDAPVPVPLEDSRANMRTIEAVVRSAASGRWEEPG